MKNKWKGKLLREMLLFNLSDNESECIVQFFGQLLIEERQRSEEKIEKLKTTDFIKLDNAEIVGAKLRNIVLDQVLSTLREKR